MQGVRSSTLLGSTIFSTESYTLSVTFVPTITFDTEANGPDSLRLPTFVQAGTG